MIAPFKSFQYSLVRSCGVLRNIETKREFFSFVMTFVNFCVIIANKGIPKDEFCNLFDKNSKIQRLFLRRREAAGGLRESYFQLIGSETVSRANFASRQNSTIVFYAAARRQKGD